MTEDAAKLAARDAPFASSPPTASGGGGGGGRLSSGSLLSGGVKTQFAAAAGRPTHSASFAAAGDADPQALIFCEPAHAPPSLAQRAHGTETLFQYYIQRGYKELLMDSNGANAGKAVQTCLEGKPNEEAVGQQVNGTAAAAGKKTMQPKNTRAIDRCVAEGPAGVPGPLRPPRAQDNNSLYRSQQADDARADVKAQRRARLHQPPTEAAYVGRYYPTTADVLPRMPGAAGAGGEKGTAAADGAQSRQSFSGSLVPCGSNSGAGRMSGSGRADAAANAGRTPSLVALLRTPQEAAAQAEQQREVRHLVARQIDEVFEAAYRHRDAVAPQRKSTGRAPSAMSAAANITNGTTTAAAAAEGSFPKNLTLFRASLLQLSNEDGAISLDQLCTMAADVPFNVGASMNSVAAAATPVSGTAVQRLFRILHPNTRAPNAPDATDLLLAVASATAPGGHNGGRQANTNVDNSLSYGGGTNATMGATTNGTAVTRAGANSTSAGNARRGMGTSVSAAAATTGMSGAPGRGARVSLQGATRGNGSPIGTSLHPPTTSVSFASNAHNAKGGVTSGPSGTWKEMGSPNGAAGRQQHQMGFPNTAPSDLKDSRKCVLILELLDAIDALLNSPETRQVVRWECFAVLAGEGHGYIHTAQLVQLRRHAYRDGSAAEVSAAVTASMVRALEDAFRIIATEEEAAYVKANKKGRKSAGAGAPLHSNVKSAIPLHLMRTSHMDFATFCRFFEELPQMPAAFAHVWLPLLLDGARRRSEAAMLGDDDNDDTDGSSDNKEAYAAVRTTLALDGASAGEGAENDRVASRGGGERAPSRGTSKSFTAAPATAGDDGEEGFPLELLGSTTMARQALIQRLLTTRLEQLQEAWDALDKQKLQYEPSGGSGAFSSPNGVSSPTF